MRNNEKEKEDGVEDRPRFRRKVAIFFYAVDSDTKDRFKALCARKGSNMTKEIARFIKRSVAQDKVLNS